MDNVFDEMAMLEQAKSGAGALAYRAELRVSFYLHATKDDVATRREKRPIYKDAIYYSVKAEGTKDFMSSPATPENIANHPTEWAAFRARMENTKTSVRALPRVTPAVLLTLDELGIHSIEDFAESTPTPELEQAHAIAVRWVGAAVPAEPKKRGWPKGKPRKGHGEDAQAVA